MQHLLAPPKLEPRLMKNRMISSRGGPQPPQPQPQAPIKQNAATRQQESIRMTGSELSSTPHKRLKLKDYLHLNDLEKRSRANRSLTSRANLETSRQSEPKLTVSSRRSVTSALGQEGDHEIALKNEILKKIQQEKAKLTDLQNYIRDDFRPKKEEKSETYLFLFSLFNGLTQTAKISNNFGKAVVEYEDNKLGGTGGQKRNYYWDRNGRGAFSPAKILPTALQMTFNVAQVLGLGKM